MHLTTDWNVDGEGNQILQVLENNKVSHYFRTFPARTDPSLWFVVKYKRSKSKPYTFIPDKTVYQGKQSNAYTFLEDTETKINAKREYNIKHIKDELREVIGKIDNHDTINRAEFDAIASKVVSTLLSLVETDDKTKDNNFIDFIEHYTYSRF